MQRLALAILFSLASVIASAQVSWLGTTHDFGTIAEDDGRVKCEFLFVNNGDSPITITRVRTTCGCTAGQFSQKEICSGDTGKVVLTFNPYMRPGDFAKKATVWVNPGKQKFTLTISGKVVGSKTTMQKLFPQNIGEMRFKNLVTLFGEMAKGTARTKFVYGYNASLDTLVVSPCTTNSPLISLKAIPDTIAPGDRCTITVHLNTLHTKAYGRLAETTEITVKNIGNGNETKGNIETFAEIIDNFATYKSLSDEMPVASLSDDRVNFGKISRSDTTTVLRTLSICNTGKLPLIIRNIQSAFPFISAGSDKNKLAKGECATITVKVQPNLIDRNILNNNIQIYTNSPQHARIDVRCVGEVN